MILKHSKKNANSKILWRIKITTWVPKKLRKSREFYSTSIGFSPFQSVSVACAGKVCLRSQRFKGRKKTLRYRIRELKAGGKPSTWFPPGGLVEQDISTLTKSTYQINFSKKVHMLDSKDGTHKHFSQSPIPQWPWFVANLEYNANGPDYSLAYSLCFATSQHAHN